MVPGPQTLLLLCAMVRLNLCATELNKIMNIISTVMTTMDKHTTENLCIVYILVLTIQHDTASSMNNVCTTSPLGCYSRCHDVQYR